MTSLREEAARKYKSRRLVEAYVFLKNLSSNTIYSEPIEESLPSSEQNDTFLVEDPSLAALISNVSFENRRPNLLQSISITAAANVDDEIHLQKFRSDTESGSSLVDIGRPKILRSKSTIETAKGLKNRIKVTSPNRLKLLHKEAYGKRLVLTSSHKVPYFIFSVIPYRSNYKGYHHDSNGPSHFHPTPHHTGNIIDNVDIADGKREVSFGPLLVPESCKKRTAHQAVSCSDIDHQHNESFEYHTFDYDPMMLDDPELTCGKHRKVLTLTSFTVSIIPYTKPSEVKKDINERFKEKYPQLTITLSKLRSIKSEMMEISQKINLDIAVVAGAFVYFEKTILKTKINKSNRKCIAGACLMLSIKFFDDVHGKNVKSCIEVIKDQFRLSHKDLLSCELQVLVLLEFAMQIQQTEIFPIIKRLETSLL